MEAQMQLARLVGSLEVPEQRHEVARCGAGPMLQLFEQRGLADPSRSQQPEALPLALQDLRQASCPTVEALASHPLTDHVGYDL